MQQFSIWNKALPSLYAGDEGCGTLGRIMYEALSMPRLLKQMEAVFDGLPDARTGGPNSRYAVADAALGAFAVFFTQAPSFLAHQRAIQLSKGRSNAEQLFGLHDLPSDNQLRNLLDPVSPQHLWPIYRHVFQALEQAGVLAHYRSHAHQLLVGLDGTQYFASKKLHCPNCSQRVLSNGQTQYFHSVLTPVVVQPGNPQVLALEPEFIVPQDGQEKQDCEMAAAKRWLEQHGRFYARQGVTVLGDDLYSRQPFCQALRDQRLHFILVCKPESHNYLYATVDFLAAKQLLGTKVVRRWTGQYAEISTYRYTEHLPLTGEPRALEVNWCEVTVTRQDTGEVLYRNSWISDFALTDTTVEAVVRDGRTRWKVENENNNVLKTKGYHLEHNFGHGQQYLASGLLSLNLLAFLIHTVLDLVDDQYRAIRAKLGTRRTFFQDLETLLRYFPFDDWAALWTFMYHGLELDKT